MRNRIKFILFSLIFASIFTSCVFASSDKNKVEDKEQVKVEKDIKKEEKTEINKEKEEKNTEDKKKSDSQKQQDKEKKEVVEEKPEDLVYNIVVAKNGSITTDHISEATYNGIIEILDEENKKGTTYKTIDQDNTIILHESYGYKLTKDVENKILNKYSSKLPNIEIMVKNNKVNKEERAQRNKKLLFLGVVLWLSLNRVPTTNEVIRKERD